jgi:nocardicin N-oxygenase
MMICEMLGVPYDDRGKFGGLPRMIMSATAGAQANQAGTDLLEYLRGLIIERRARPTVDMISALVQACDNDGQITEDELVALAENLLVGSYETTANEMANFLFILLSRPDQLAWLRQDLSRVPAAVEELLRFVPLAAGAPGAGGHARIATADVELDGVTIRAGDAVLPSIVSANRDERVFAQPDQLDLTRRSNPHVAFGHGIHHCVGAQLARMELQATLAGLLSRFPALRLAVPPDEVPWKIGFIQRGPAELLAEW